MRVGRGRDPERMKIVEMKEDALNELSYRNPNQLVIPIVANEKVRKNEKKKKRKMKRS